MPTFGVIKYIRDGLEEELNNPSKIDRETGHAKYSIGMLYDILDRMDHTIHTKAIEKPSQLISATVRVCAGAVAVLIMEIAQEGKIDTGKDIAVDQFKEEVELALKVYKLAFDKKDKTWF